MKKVQLRGIMLQNKKLSKEMKVALTSLDVKIAEFETKYRNGSYDNSLEEGIGDYSEILGILKFLFVANILTMVEYNNIVNRTKSIVTQNKEGLKHAKL